MRIRTYVVLMALALLLPVVLATGLAMQKIREGERQAVLRGLAETARATALIVDREVQASLAALAALGNSQRLEQGDLAGFYAEAQALNRLPNVWTLLLDAQGNQLLNTVVPFGTPAPAPAPAAPDRVAQVLASGKPVVTDILTGPVTGRMLTVAHVPARAAGGRKYVVAQAFALEHWSGTALAATLPRDWIVAVIDRQGRFIARSHNAARLLGRPARPELVAAAAAAHDGTVRHATVENVQSYDAFTHSAATGWTIAVAAPVASVEASARRAMEFVLLGLALAVLAGIVAMAAFGERLVRTIRTASEAAVALGKGGRPRPARSGIEEVDVLHLSLADAGNLLHAERRSRQAAEAERERLLSGETAAREAAQAQNLAKDQFLAMLGHELRNPLAAISGAISLLEMGGVQKERTDRYLDIIRRQNRHLAHIVNDLLDVSRLLAGKIALERMPMNLADCVRGCVEAVKVTDRAIGFRIEVWAEPVWIEGDPVRIDQVLNNLLTNALKFSPPGSTVEVLVRAEGGNAVVTVRDNGQGMAPELVERVFEPFVQGPAPARHAQSGLGIGLALVKQLVALHGGEVRAASAGPGRGSEFGFSIPAIAAPSGAPAPGGAPRGARHRLVYVEDNPDARATTAELLRAMGYEVLEVATGEAAQQAVAGMRPDAVILDIGLPGIDGYEVARRLRADPALRAIPLVALTGYGQLADRDTALLAGFSAHLVKPVAPQALAAAIEAAVGRTAVFK